ncbi:MAG TPA: hypothetical protein VJY33_15460, partial [Isosphaeraceae bacterium]|nr:hypothetical protein [Isosphaeraceae bacterium]
PIPTECVPADLLPQENRATVMVLPLSGAFRIGRGRRFGPLRAGMAWTIPAVFEQCRPRKKTGT